MSGITATAVRVITSAALVLSLLPAMSLAADAATTPSYIVVYRDGVDAAAKTAQLEQRLGFVTRHAYASAVRGLAAALSASQLASVKADPDVLFVQVDAAVRAIDALVAGESVPTGAMRIGAATATTAHAAAPFAVAVIDTGIQLDHPDLSAVAGTDCIDPLNGAKDRHGHGTHVAGIIGAKNSGAGVVGVAAGTRLVSVRVLDQNGGGTISSVICGVDWVTANAAALGIRVANLSLIVAGKNDYNCGTTNADALHRAICASTAKGVVYVAGAGNSSADVAGYVPAAYPEVLTVTAIADSDGKSGGTGGAPSCYGGQLDDKYASFSDYAGSKDTKTMAHTIAAPGVCIKSTWIGSTYQVASGTSMAAPHVAATAALCIAKGVCTGSAATIVSKLVADAKARTTTLKSYGYSGDPARPVSGKYFGYLAWAGAY